MKVKGKQAVKLHAQLLKRAQAEVGRLERQLEPLKHLMGRAAGIHRTKVREALLRANIKLMGLQAVAPGKEQRETPGLWRERILGALQESDGPMSIRELTDAVKPETMDFLIARSSVRKAVNQLHKSELWGGKVHVAEWVRERLPGMTREYPVAKFALGAGRDAPPIGALTGSELCRRYRKKQAAFVPSVFALGTPKHTRRIAAGL